eukprot:TRINITY_DN14475_c0_g1_i2.p1 TRINITY_DN14475_c0_g1~~TRINITY_DN14475_c0_g1_i2.p1  ORF type:complete len:218 (-),score=55.73 TRINITY_DN14475_c0_g1_i2:135-788(-)
MRIIVVCVLAFLAVVASSTNLRASHFSNSTTRSIHSINGNTSQECIDTFNNFFFLLNDGSDIKDLFIAGKQAFNACTTRIAEINATLASNPNKTDSCIRAIELIAQAAIVVGSGIIFEENADDAEYFARATAGFFYSRTQCGGAEYNWGALLAEVLKDASVDPYCADQAGRITTDALAIIKNHLDISIVLQYAADIGYVFQTLTSEQRCGFGTAIYI